MIGFTDIKIILDRLVDGEEIRMHGTFWRGKSRDQFVNLRVMGLPVISVGNAADSNLVKALRGRAPFGSDLQPRPRGARFSRMPFGRSPATEEDIVRIEEWINAGCAATVAEDTLEMAAEPGDGAIDELHHVRFWREFDDFFLFKATPETRGHVGDFIGISGQIWQSFIFQNTSLGDWTAHIAMSDVRKSIDFIQRHHVRLINSFYGSPGTATAYFDSLWQFGGNLLPDDPHSSGPIRHTMNSPQDWFNWSPFLDAILRIDGTNADALLLARAWQIGLVADGLLRTDVGRPPGNRLTITDFQANDPNLRASVFAHYANAASDDLLAEFARRLRETGVIIPALV